MTTMTLDRSVRRPTPSRAQPAAGLSLRLTRRGRLVVLTVLVVLLAIAFTLGRASDAGASRITGEPTPPRATTVVQPGETLWAIARRAVPGVDPRVTVARIVELNGLGTRPVQPGQRLVLPR